MKLIISRGHSIITFELRGGAGSIKIKHANRGRGELCQWEHSHMFFLIEHLVHKLPTIITRVLVWERVPFLVMLQACSLQHYQKGTLSKEFFKDFDKKIQNTYVAISVYFWRTTTEQVFNLSLYKFFRNDENLFFSVSFLSF